LIKRWLFRDVISISTGEVRCILRSLEVALDGPALMLGDNMSVVLNTTFPSNVLKKKHNAIAYDRVRKAIVARIMRFA
jgi:hypothetical protein